VRLRRDRAVYEGRARDLLALVGLAGFEERCPWQLSGGMQQRVSLCRALIHEPRLLILDEPTAGVDVELRIELWQWLKKLNAEGLTIFLTTHYLEEAEELCRRIAIVRGGRIVTEKPTEELVAAGSSLQDVFLELVRD